MRLPCQPARGIFWSQEVNLASTCDQRNQTSQLVTVELCGVCTARVITWQLFPFLEILVSLIVMLILKETFRAAEGRHKQAQNIGIDILSPLKLILQICLPVHISPVFRMKCQQSVCTDRFRLVRVTGHVPSDWRVYKTCHITVTLQGNNQTFMSGGGGEGGGVGSHEAAKHSKV